MQIMPMRRGQSSPNDNSHADGAEDFAQETDGDDRPGRFEFPGGVQIQETVDADDHAEAGPDARIARRREVEEFEECQRPEAGPQAEGQVVAAGQSERDAKQSIGKRARHAGDYIAPGRIEIA